MPLFRDTNTHLTEMARVVACQQGPRRTLKTNFAARPVIEHSKAQGQTTSMNHARPQAITFRNVKTNVRITPVRLWPQQSYNTRGNWRQHQTAHCFSTTLDNGNQQTSYDMSCCPKETQCRRHIQCERTSNVATGTRDANWRLITPSELKDRPTLNGKGFVRYVNRWHTSIPVGHSNTYHPVR